ncbi:MAG: aminotransferase class IV [Phycisphaerae bacterium]
MEYVSLNGLVVPYEEATIAVGDAGLLHGVGLFETMRVHHGKIFRLNDHVRRINASAKALDLPVLVTAEFVESILPDLLSSNNLDTGSGDARVRLTVTPGDPRPTAATPVTAAGATEVAHPQVTFLLTAAEFRPYPKELFEKGMSAIISGYKANPLSPLAGHKTTCYFDRLIALRQAHAAGCGEAFWFTTRHETLTEGCISNVFIVDQQGLLATPPLLIAPEVLGIPAASPNVNGTPAASSAPNLPLCLPGVARKLMTELAMQADILPHERLITIDDLLQAREVFITNSIMGVMPIVRIERHGVGDEKPGPITRQFMEAYAKRLEEECRG